MTIQGGKMKDGGGGDSGKEQSARMAAMENFLRKEEQYLAALQRGREAWATLHAIAKADPWIISPDAVDKIFYGLLPLEGLHQMFFSSLMLCDSHSSFTNLLCSTFRSLAGPYTRFVQCFDAAVEALGLACWKHIEVWNICKGDSEVRGSGGVLDSLLEPLFRLIEYRKFARFLVEQTPPSQSASYEDLLVALTLVEETALPSERAEDVRGLHVVQSMLAPPEQHDIYVPIIKLDRKLLKQGGLLLWQPDSQDWVQRHMVLCTDVLFAFRTDESGIVLAEHVETDLISLDLETQTDTTAAFEIILTSGARLTFLSASRPDKLDWAHALSSACGQLQPAGSISRVAMKVLDGLDEAAPSSAAPVAHGSRTSSPPKGFQDAQPAFSDPAVYGGLEEPKIFGEEASVLLQDLERRLWRLRNQHEIESRGASPFSLANERYGQPGNVAKIDALPWAAEDWTGWVSGGGMPTHSASRLAPQRSNAPLAGGRRVQNGSQHPALHALSLLNHDKSSPAPKIEDLEARMRMLESTFKGHSTPNKAGRRAEVDDDGQVAPTHGSQADLIRMLGKGIRSQERAPSTHHLPVIDGVRRQFAPLESNSQFTERYTSKDIGPAAHTTGPIPWSPFPYPQPLVHRQYIGPPPIVVDGGSGEGHLFLKMRIPAPGEGQEGSQRMAGLSQKMRPRGHGAAETGCIVACYQESTAGPIRFALDVHCVDDVYSSRPAVLASLTRRNAPRSSPSSNKQHSRVKAYGEWWLQVPGHPPVACITLTAIEGDDKACHIDLEILHEDYENVVEQGERHYTGVVCAERWTHKSAGRASLFAYTSGRVVLSLSPLAAAWESGMGHVCQLDYDYPLSPLIALAVTALVAAHPPDHILSNLA